MPKAAARSAQRCRSGRRGLYGLLLALAAAPGLAQTVEWEATGLIQEIAQGTGSADDFPSAVVGSPFRIVVRFNPVGAPSTQTAGEHGSSYLYTDAIESVQAFVADDQLDRAPGSFRFIDAWDDYSPVHLPRRPADGLLFAYGVESISPNGIAALTLTFRGPESLDIVDGVGLPRVPPDALTDLALSRFEFRDGAYQLAGDIREVRSTAPDSDGDGLADDVDNCTAVANADQIDTDADGYGNLCDPDLNNDCIVNVVDLGLFRTVFFSGNPDADFNSDTVVNVVDLSVLRAYSYLPPGPAASDVCASPGT